MLKIGIKLLLFFAFVSTLAFRLPIEANAAALPIGGFSDVLTTDPNAYYIGDLKSRGLIEGTAEGIFSPEAPLTREQFAKLVVGAFGLKTSLDPVPFTDLVNVWSRPYIAAAYSAKLIEGTSDRTFSPAATLTREAAATIIWRKIQSEGLKAAGNFEDYNASDADAWAVTAVQNVMALGLRTEGKQHFPYNSKDIMTRGDAAALIDLSIKYMETGSRESVQDQIQLTEGQIIKIIQGNERAILDILAKQMDEYPATTLKPYSELEHQVLKYTTTRWNQAKYKDVYEKKYTSLVEPANLFPSLFLNFVPSSAKIIEQRDGKIIVKVERTHDARNMLTYTLLKEGEWKIDELKEEESKVEEPKVDVLSKPITAEEAVEIIHKFYPDTKELVSMDNFSNEKIFAFKGRITDILYEYYAVQKMNGEVSVFNPRALRD